MQHESRGPSQRQLRVGELIRRTLSDVLIRGEIHDPDLNRMSITVGEVRISPDLRIATAYVLSVPLNIFAFIGELMFLILLLSLSPSLPLCFLFLLYTLIDAGGHGR